MLRCALLWYIARALVGWIACKRKPVHPAALAHSGTKLAEQASVFEAEPR